MSEPEDDRDQGVKRTAEGDVKEQSSKCILEHPNACFFKFLRTYFLKHMFLRPYLTKHGF